jgi:hypothetical protein
LIGLWDSKATCKILDALQLKNKVGTMLREEDGEIGTTTRGIRDL